MADPTNREAPSFRAGNVTWRWIEDYARRLERVSTEAQHRTRAEERNGVLMAINPGTNKIEPILNLLKGDLVRPDGSKVPKHWSTFRVGELVTIKDYTFKVAYIGEANILFEPVGPVDLQRKVDLENALDEAKREYAKLKESTK